MTECLGIINNIYNHLLFDCVIATSAGHASPTQYAAVPLCGGAVPDLHIWGPYRL